jgi:hypothetical protein
MPKRYTADFYGRGHNKWLFAEAIKHLPQGSVMGSRYDKHQMAVLDSEKQPAAVTP